MSILPVYDHSQLQAYKDCPERYRLKYVENLQKRTSGEEDHDRNFGSAIHSALEVLYKARMDKKPLLKDVYHKAFMDNYPVSLKEEDMAKTPESGIILLDEYVGRYGIEDNDLEILGVEVTDSFPVGSYTDPVSGKEVEILFTVKIDLIVRKQGCIYFLDHKTTGKTLTYAYWNQFEPNAQVTGYTAYCLWKYGECSGGIINALRFGHRQRMYKGEPAGFYQEFQRNIINRNQAQVLAWKADTIRWIQGVEGDKALVMPGMSWNKNEGQCMYCSYKEICTSVNDEQIIEQLYEKHDPRAYLGGSEPKGLTA